MMVRSKGVVMKYLGVLFDFLLFPLFFLNRLVYRESREKGDTVYKKGYHYHLTPLIFPLSVSRLGIHREVEEFLLWKI